MLGSGVIGGECLLLVFNRLKKVDDSDECVKGN
jgi:hypothetical protein